MSPLGWLFVVSLVVSSAAAHVCLYGGRWHSTFHPYYAARVEEHRTVVLPGSRGALLAHALLMITWSTVGLVSVIDVDPLPGLLEAYVTLFGLGVIVGLLGLLSVWRPAELRFDERHLTYRGLLDEVAVAWEDVVVAGTLPMAKQMRVHVAPGSGRRVVARATRVGLTCFKRDVLNLRTLPWHRTDIVARLIRDMATLDEVGRREMIQEAVLSVLTVPASTRRDLDRYYGEIVQPQRRQEASFHRGSRAR